MITTRSKEKQKKNDENQSDLFSEISMDLKVEILVKLPVKSIAKFIFVSKMWSSVIRSKEFVDLYMSRSALARPRLLFNVYRPMMHHFFYSCSQECPSYYDHHHRVNFTLNPGHCYKFSSPVRGLICCQNDYGVLVGNPSTGQFVTLPFPRVRTMEVELFTFFGYDPGNDVYKVLCMMADKLYITYEDRSRYLVSEEHQVYTLGAQEPWRMIQCKHPHLPYRHKGLYMNGCMYYYARINKKPSLISFDVSSEEFDVIRLPEGVRSRELFRHVVWNYNGKIALTAQSSHNGTFDIRILQDASKQEWSRLSVAVPSWRDLVGDDLFWLEGEVSTGELIFSKRSFLDTSYLIYYNVKENHIEDALLIWA